VCFNRSWNYYVIFFVRIFEGNFLQGIFFEGIVLDFFFSTKLLKKIKILLKKVLLKKVKFR
jgi:hypothetical protein